MPSGRRWSDLSPRSRRLIVVGATVEALVKLAALVDLAQRPARQVRGAKAAWATAIVVVNAAGAVPLAYFRYGRRSGTG
jgi:hypothetical protein